MTSDETLQAKRKRRDIARRQFLESLPLSISELDTLLEKLDAELHKSSCDHSMQKTETVMGDLPVNKTKVTHWLNEQGAFCDCGVLTNIEYELEDAKKINE